jgi:hypothetical protein
MSWEAGLWFLVIDRIWPTVRDAFLKGGGENRLAWARHADSSIPDRGSRRTVNAFRLYFIKVRNFYRALPAWMCLFAKLGSKDAVTLESLAVPSWERTTRNACLVEGQVRLLLRTGTFEACRVKLKSLRASQAFQLNWVPIVRLRTSNAFSKSICKVPSGIADTFTQGSIPNSITHALKARKRFAIPNSLTGNADVIFVEERSLLRAIANLCYRIHNEPRWTAKAFCRVWIPKSWEITGNTLSKSISIIFLLGTDATIC